MTLKYEIGYNDEAGVAYQMVPSAKRGKMIAEPVVLIDPDLFGTEFIVATWADQYSAEVRKKTKK